MENNNNNDASIAEGIQRSSTPDSRLKAIDRCINYLVHASGCKAPDCKLPSCRKMKRIILHAKSCEWMNQGECSICKQLIALCRKHAKHCKEPTCPVPYCACIKRKRREEQSQQKQATDAQDLRSRIIAMQNRRMVRNILQQNAVHPGSSAQTSSAGQPCSTFYSLPSDPASSSEVSVGAFLAVQEVKVPAERQAAQASMSQIMSGIPNPMLNPENVPSWGNSGYVQDQQPHQDALLRTQRTHVQTTENSNSEPNSIDSEIEMSNEDPSVAGIQMSA